MRNIATAFALATGVFLAWHSTSSADETCPCPVAAQATTPQPMINEIPGGPPIVLEAGSSTIFRSSGALNNVFIANRAVADVEVHRTPGRNDVLYVYGKKPGRTVLSAVDA